MYMMIKNGINGFKWKRIVLLLLYLVTCKVSIVAGETGREVLVTGKTMGTTYHIKVIASAHDDTSPLKAKIDKRLLQLNQSMSTYLPDSEITRFNKTATLNKPFKISKEFYAVLAVAQKIYHLTHGAWDGTVNPLVNLWGFGAQGQRQNPPEPTKIQSLLKEVGFQYIELIQPSFIVKHKSGISLDLASIAKGYGVDQIADELKANGYTNFLVEIGGEVYASGLRKDGGKWRVGVNVPQQGAPLDAVYQAIEIENQAMATSGDYRNYFNYKGTTYSHIIDPKTGSPVQNGVASVSIKADSCMFADGLATAIVVMGAKAGLDLVNRLKHVESLIVVRGANGDLTNYRSTHF